MTGNREQNTESAPQPSKPEDQMPQLTFVELLRQEYQQAMSAIDSQVPALIRDGREMQALLLLLRTQAAVFELHKTLSTYYGLVLRNMENLREFSSERVRRMGGNPIPTWEILKNQSSGKEDWECMQETIAIFRRVNFFKQHWVFPELVITEVEYMLDVLAMFIEPGFNPVEPWRSPSEEGEQADVDRYIPSNVKLAVWRRDQGKCAKCGSQDRLEYDHIIPVSKGGSSTERNIQLLCERCNREKAAAIA
jgi:HNH endonuclease